jgi:hypothetical protein
MVWYWIAGIVIAAVAVERTGTLYWRPRIARKPVKSDQQEQAEQEEREKHEAHVRRVMSSIADKFTGGRY